MTEKLDAAIALHLPLTDKRRISDLAALRGDGSGESGYIRDLVKAHLDQLEYETKVKAKIFGLTGNEGN